MSGIQHGRAKAKKIFKKPRTVAKAIRMYDEVFNDKNLVGRADREAAPQYSRVTHKIISSSRKG